MDLDWTNEQWNELFQKIGMLAESYNELSEMSRRYRKQRCVVHPHYDIEQDLSEWELKDVKYRHDTDDAGNIYVAITSAVDPRIVSLYKDEARTEKVAEGTADAGDTATLAAEAGYTVNGSVKLSATVSPNADIFIKVANDYRRNIYDDYGTIRQYEADMRAALDAQFFTMGGNLINMSDRVKASSDALFLNYISNLIQSGASRVDNKRLRYAPDGSASVDWGSGILADLADAMTDNDGGTNVQYVGRNDTDTGLLEEDIDNQGELEKIALKCGEFNWVPNGKLIVLCTADGIGQETFDLRFYDDDDSVHRNCRGGFRLGIQYIDLEVGIKLGLKATYEAAGALESDTSEYNTAGESEANSNNGIWYVDYIDDTKVINVYSDAGKTELVAQGVWNETLGSTVTCEEQNGSGLTMMIKVDADPGADKSMTVTINSPKEGDKWYIPYTNKRDNAWATFFGEAYRFEMPDSGDHEIPEELAGKFYYP